MGAHPSGLGTHVPLPEYIENMRKIATHLKVTISKGRMQLHKQVAKVLTYVKIFYSGSIWKDTCYFPYLPPSKWGNGSPAVTKVVWWLGNSIYLFLCSSANHFTLLKLSSAISEIVRTNERCQRYSEACIELCKEMGVEVVDLFTAIQKRDDWPTACFT